MSADRAPSSSSPWWRWLRRLALTSLGLVVLAWLGVVALLYVRQDDLLYHPTATVSRTPDAAGLAFEDLEVRTDDGETLAAWWVPHLRPRCTVIVFHGNAGNRAGRVDDVRRFAELGCNVFIADYRGYGGSTGTPSEDGTYADARASWDAAIEAGADPSTTLVFGRSLGGPIAAYLAAERSAAGLVIESTFVSLPELASELYPWFSFDALVRNRYPTHAFVAQFDGPVLVLHSPQDDLIPYAHGERLAAIAGKRGRLVTIAGDHNHGPSTTGEAYLRALRAHVDTVVGE